MSNYSTKCNCSGKHSAKIYCPNCSKISMSILLKNGNDHLKLTNGRGRKVCPVWYSPLKYNEKPDKDIIAGMLRRFFKSPFTNVANKVNFYSNNSDSLIFSHTL